MRRLMLGWLVVLSLVGSLQAQRNINWSAIAEATTAAGMPIIKGVATGITPSLTMNHVLTTGYKSQLIFQDDGTLKGAFGIDYSNDGTRRLFLDAAYLVKWPEAQGAAGTMLQNDGAGDLSWVTPGGGGTGGWTDSGTVVRLTTATDQVGIGTSSPVSGVTAQITESATGAIGGDLWITNSGANAIGSSARLVWGPDATTDTTPNWALEAIVTNVANFRSDLVWSAYDGTSYAEKMRLAISANGAAADLKLVGTDAGMRTTSGYGPSSTRSLDFYSNTATPDIRITRADYSNDGMALRLVNRLTSSNPATAWNEIQSLDQTGTPVVIGLQFKSSFLEMTGLNSTANAATNSARFYLVDAGGGKDRIVICFESGACQTVVTEP